MSQSNIPGAPVMHAGSVIVTAPKHRASRPKSITLRPIDDIVYPQLLESGSKSDQQILREFGYVPSKSQPFGHYVAPKGSPVGTARGQHSRVNHGSYISYWQPKGGALPPPEVQSKAARVKSARSVARADIRAACDQLIRAAGYTGPINASMRRAARDVLAANQQTREYCE